MDSDESKKRNKKHFVFAILIIVKACIFYVFSDEYAKLARRPELTGITLYKHLHLRLFWAIAAGLLAAGILLDLITLVSSLFNRRLAIIFLCLSGFIHCVFIVPQQSASLYMAIRYEKETTSEVDWYSDFKELEELCRNHSAPNPSDDEIIHVSDSVRTIYKRGIKNVQNDLKCCGFRKPQDWTYEYCPNILQRKVNVGNDEVAVVPWWSETEKYPYSCCRYPITTKDGKVECRGNAESKWSSVGCHQGVNELIYRVLLAFACILLSIELIYFPIMILFYIFLIWKPMPTAKPMEKPLLDQPVSEPSKKPVIERVPPTSSDKPHSSDKPDSANPDEEIRSREANNHLSKETNSANPSNSDPEAQTAIPMVISKSEVRKVDQSLKHTAIPAEVKVLKADQSAKKSPPKETKSKKHVLSQYL